MNFAFYDIVDEHIRTMVVFEIISLLKSINLVRIKIKAFE